MKVSMVTGANRGIGLELAKRLTEVKENIVIVCSRSMSKELEDLLKNDHVYHVNLDITSQESVNQAFDMVEALLEGKGINLLVNNAAILVTSDSPSSTSPEDLTKNFDVNVVGTHRVSTKFAPLLYQAAENNATLDVGCERAFCLNISSAVGSMGNTTTYFHTAYRVSKAALNMLTRVSAIEFLEKGVLCCSVHPGWVQTEMGGPNALISTKKCVDDLMEVIKNASKDHSGVMLRNKMEVMPF